MGRIRRALHTNDAQLGAVSALTILNLITYMGASNHTLLGLAVALFCWPAIAFAFNLIDPIP